MYAPALGRSRHSTRCPCETLNGSERCCAFVPRPALGRITSATCPESPAGSRSSGLRSGSARPIRVSSPRTSAKTRKAVLLDGTSKAFAMTGWRIGFSYTAPDVAEKLSALQSQTTSNASTPAQYAALAAYKLRDEVDAAVEEMRAAFQRRRDLVLELFEKQLPGVSVLIPRGAFYLWVNGERFAREGEGSVQFCERLLDEYGVGVVPGEAFGDDRYFRMSFAYSEDTLRDAVNRLEKAL